MTVLTILVQQCNYTGVPTIQLKRNMRKRVESVSTLF